MVNIEVGQVVYVSESGFYNTKPNLAEFVVTKVNGSSFYAVDKDSKNQRENRFNRKTMISKSGMGYDRIAYLTEEEYWSMIQRAKDKNELKNNLIIEVKKATYEQLLAIENLLKTL